MIRKVADNRRLCAKTEDASFSSSGTTIVADIKFVEVKTEGEDSDMMDVTYIHKSLTIKNAGSATIDEVLNRLREEVRKTVIEMVIME